MNWKIITDSGCNLEKIENLARNTEFEKVPLTLTIGEQSYIDDFDLDSEKLLNEMYASQEKVGSSCPSPDMYKKSFKNAENIIALTITGTLSGSYNSARIAKDAILEENPNVNICVIDTKSAGAHMDLIVLEINRLINEGLNFEQVIDKIKHYVENTRLLFILEKVDNLVKNGRLNKLVGGVIGLLNIKLVGRASKDGVLELLHKARGSKRAILSLVDEMLKSGYNGGKVSICHCQNVELAQEIIKSILEKFPQAVINNVSTKGLCSFYAERGGIMLGYEIN